ncbi:MAG: RuBisCO accumulation factor 1 [Elainellaceae cyanobacterium]
MTASPADQPHPPDPALNADDLLRSLRRKEGNWVSWGEACLQLQKAGYSPQQIFEETGFEPVQQNQIGVAAQVFASITATGIPEGVRSHFEQRGSDTLYEFRILTQTERAAAATLCLEKGIDSEGAREVARAIKDFSRFTTPPEGFQSFADHPGDAIAYHYWKLARQQSDLQMRSRLIASGLRFAESDSARTRLETLLTDFSVTRQRRQPLLPAYRPDSEEEVPRVVPVAGRLPLTAADVKAVPLLEETGDFHIVTAGGAAGMGAWVAFPGWQVVWLAEDPVAILADSDQLPVNSARSEEVMVLVDRTQRQWNPDSYFLAEQGGHLQVLWLEEEPADLPLLGRVLLVLRPRQVIDENLSRDPWQVEE